MRGLLGLFPVLTSLSCVLIPAQAPPPTELPTPLIDESVYRRAETERADRLAREVEQLRTDLARAEEALVEAESGLRGQHSRADAVSSLASVRIRVARAERSAPWRAGRIAVLRAKLEEAALQVEQGHYGAALFFVYRAERIADELEAEAARAEASEGTLSVRSKRVNLREGPSTRHRVVEVLEGGTPVYPEGREGDWMLVRSAGGVVGWIHSALLSPWQAETASR